MCASTLYGRAGNSTVLKVGITRASNLLSFNYVMGAIIFLPEGGRLAVMAPFSFV